MARLEVQRKQSRRKFTLSEKNAETLQKVMQRMQVQLEGLAWSSMTVNNESVCFEFENAKLLINSPPNTVRGFELLSGETLGRHDKTQVVFQNHSSPGDSGLNLSSNCEVEVTLTSKQITDKICSDRAEYGYSISILAENNNTATIQLTEQPIEISLTVSDITTCFSIK